MKIAEQYKSARMINMLYNTFLGRNADPDGLRHHLQRFVALGFMDATKATVDILMNSLEFQTNYRTKKRVAFPAGTRQINGKCVRHIISLGNHCLPATILQKYGLKKYSTPFDWIFTNPEMVIDCLMDNFSTLMNPIYHQSITHTRKHKDYEPGANHLLYTKRYPLSDIFTHRDITNKEDYQYFSRAVDRFNQILSTDEGKIFIMVSRPAWSLEASFVKLVELLNQKTTHFAFYGFQLKPPTSAEQSANIKQIKNIDSSFLYELTPSFNEGFTGRFDNHLDESLILSLLSEYDIDI